MARLGRAFPNRQHQPLNAALNVQEGGGGGGGGGGAAGTNLPLMGVGNKTAA